MCEKGSESKESAWKYPHIDHIGKIMEENYELIRDYYFQEKIDGANITIKFKAIQADTKLVDRTFYSRNWELKPGCNFHHIWEVVKKLESFFEDVDNYVKTKLGPEDTFLVNCELYGSDINKRVYYGFNEQNRFVCFDCRLNGKFFSGLEFLTFQTEFLPNRERYPYWPFVISFNYGDHLAQFAELYANKQIVDVPASILTSDKSYDEIFAVIKSIKPKQNKFEGIVLKSLVNVNFIYKRVYNAFRVADPDAFPKIEKLKNDLNETEIKMIELCNADYMINCLSKRPWTSLQVYNTDLVKDLKEDVQAQDGVDSRKIIKVLLPKIKELINPRNGSLY